MSALDIIVVVAGLERDGRHCSPDGCCVNVNGRYSMGDVVGVVNCQTVSIT
jgi:hypothetical protein